MSYPGLFALVDADLPTGDVGWVVLGQEEARAVNVVLDKFVKVRLRHLFLSLTVRGCKQKCM